MRGYAGVDEDVVCAGVPIDVEAAEDEEASPVVNLVRQFPQYRMESWEGECLLTDVAGFEVQGCGR